ncbi:hypothetical protein JZU68_07950, partial [bacterium]|nr:hypothetical protein [bacterium]
MNGKILFVSIAQKGIFEFDERSGNSVKALAVSDNENITNSYIDSYDKVWFEINQSTIIYYDP